MLSGARADDATPAPPVYPPSPCGRPDIPKGVPVIVPTARSGGPRVTHGNFAGGGGRSSGGSTKSILSSAGSSEGSAERMVRRSDWSSEGVKVLEAGDEAGLSLGEAVDGESEVLSKRRKVMRKTGLDAGGQ
jgi:hypothetical protein